MPLYGPKWPLTKGNRDTYELYESVEEQISFYLKNLILTSPGENISDPSYGVGLRRYLFENNTEVIRPVIESHITNQIRKYLPYLALSEVLVGASDKEVDENTLNIRIIYSTPDDVITKIFDLDIKEKQSIGFY